jgi:hypothetical protein
MLLNGVPLLGCNDKWNIYLRKICNHFWTNFFTHRILSLISAYPRDMLIAWKKYRFYKRAGEVGGLSGGFSIFKQSLKDRSGHQ